MDRKYLLPELNSKEFVGTSNCWEEQDRIYDFLLERLKLYYEPRKSIFDGGSSSYPHIFEQMLLFHNAFLETEDPDHERAVMEWRACLAIMALQSIKNVRLDMIKVDLKESTNAFLQAAAVFCPEEEPVFYHTTWDYIYVLCMDNEPIAMTSPITVICPAKQFCQKISQLRWIKLEKQDGREQLVFDFKGEGNEYSNLECWLKKLDCCLERNPNDIAPAKAYQRIKGEDGELQQYIQWVQGEGTAEINAEMKDNLYHDMNNDARKKYNFLNFCCDFHIDDPAMEFLKRRYHSDIFQDKLFVIAYDDRPESMFQAENLEKMGELFQQVPQINGERIIAVKEPGGTPLPIYVLLPFKDSFVNELDRYHIRPEKMLEECKIEYIQSQDAMDITMRIKGFPYTFDKRFRKDKWISLQGIQMADTYIWPGCQVNEKWKAYYTFVAKKQPVRIDIPNAVVKRVGETNAALEKEMYIFRTKKFPSYIRYESNGVSGYFPVKAEDKALNESGGTATVFIHIGHSMTYVKIMGENKERESGRSLAFSIPKSLKVIGQEDHDDDVGAYFVSPKSHEEGEGRKARNRKYFKNMLHSFWDNSLENQYAELRPMQDGQIIFDSAALDSILQKRIVSFFNFEYYLMHEKQRRNVHLYLEEILLYAAFQIICQGYTYMKVKYLYYVEDTDDRLGQLKGLWENAFFWVKKWTGIEGHIGQSVDSLSEPEAMVHLLYGHLFNNNFFETSKSKDTWQELYVGVDIGWSKTLVCMLNSKEVEQENLNNTEVQNKWAQINFAARHLSLLDSKSELSIYPEILSILLRGSDKIDDDGLDGKLLQEFKLMYKNEELAEEYYLGIFDVLAMRIEDAGFKIPPDVYNRKQQFRAFLEVMTYNVFMLFLNIGYVVGKMWSPLGVKPDLPPKVYIFLSGNGAKLLKWVASLKQDSVINDQNAKEFFVCRTKSSLLKVGEKGFEISSKEEKVKFCGIEFLGEDERMIDGYVFKELYENSHSSVVLQKPQEIKNTFEEGEMERFYEVLGETKSDFEEAIFHNSVWHGTSQRKNTTPEEVIRSEAENTKKQLESEIHQMGSD